MSRELTRTLIRTISMMTVISLLYFALPFTIASRVEFLSGLGIVAVGIVGFVVLLRFQLRATTEETTALVAVERLLTTLYLLVFFFAAVYYALSLTAGQIEGIATKIDAVYYAASIATTVGFGDINAVGQSARTVVAANMLFDMVYIGLAVRTLARYAKLP